MYESYSRAEWMDTLCRILTGWFVVVTMPLLFWAFHGPDVPDWIGYEELYSAGGAWLLAQGRDPIFIWLLQQARDVFGDRGYETFRMCLFGVFTLFSGWVAIVAPLQRRLGSFSALPVILMLVAAFLLKGLVQIREGIAFVLVLAPIVVMFAFEKRRFIRPGLGAAIAAAVHAGTAIFGIVWIVAALQAVLDRLVLSLHYQRLLTVLGVAIGLCLAWFFLRDDSAIRFLLQDNGVDTSGAAGGGLAKYAYWLGNGVLVFIVRHQVIRAAGPRQFGFLYASTLGSFLMPMLYAVCVYMVFTSFQVPALTSMVIRLLFTTMELALAIIICQGRATWLTVGVMVAMIADRARLLVG